MDTKWILIPAFAASLLAVPARADDTENDVRCMVVSLSLMSSPDKAMQVAGTIAQMYWLGRLDGRTPDMDLENRLLADASQMKPEDIRNEAIRCGQILTARGKTMTDIGRDMQQKGAALRQQENSN
jgi:hypothetical protein